MSVQNINNKYFADQNTKSNQKQKLRIFDYIYRQGEVDIPCHPLMTMHADCA